MRSRLLLMLPTALLFFYCNGAAQGIPNYSLKNRGAYTNARYKGNVKCVTQNSSFSNSIAYYDRYGYLTEQILCASPTNLRGDIIRTYTHTNGKLIREVSQSRLSVQTNTYSYDIHGNLIEDRSLYNGVFESALHFVHDANNRLITETNFADDTISMRTNYFYNEDGTVACEEMLYGFNTYRYDGKKNLIESFFFNSYFGIGRQHTYKYNQKNQLIESVEFDLRKTGILRTSLERYTYNTKGKKLTNEWYDGNDSLSGMITYTYDNNSNETSTTLTNKDGHTTLRSVNEYDVHNNIILHKSFRLDPNGHNKQTETLYRYEYYPN